MSRRFLHLLVKKPTPCGFSEEFALRRIDMLRFFPPRKPSGGADGSADADRPRPAVAAAATAMVDAQLPRAGEAIYRPEGRGWGQGRRDGPRRRQGQGDRRGRREPQLPADPVQVRRPRRPPPPRHARTQAEPHRLHRRRRHLRHGGGAARAAADALGGSLLRGARPRPAAGAAGGGQDRHRGLALALPAGAALRARPRRRRARPRRLPRGGRRLPNLGVHGAARHVLLRYGERRVVRGRAGHVPEHNLWFGFSPCDDGHLCASDLTATPPSPRCTWRYRPSPPHKDWPAPVASYLVPLGAGRLCVAEQFETTRVEVGGRPLDDKKKKAASKTTTRRWGFKAAAAAEEEEDEEETKVTERFAVVTGVEVEASASGKALRMAKHAVRRYVLSTEMVVSRKAAGCNKVHSRRHRPRGRPMKDDDEMLHLVF